MHRFSHLLTPKNLTKCFHFQNRAKRTFFASSTDHTTLLQNAEIHCLPQDNDEKLYVLVAQGMDTEKVKSVPYLHLGRICLNTNENIIYGAKVINKTLGDVIQVCDRLLDAALDDAGGKGNGVHALSTLHGLSAWTDQYHLQNKEESSVLSNLKESEWKAVEVISKGSGANIDVDLYKRGKDGWEQLATEYLAQKLGKEAALYKSKGGILQSIEHLKDTSEYANTCGGAMALFKF